MGPEPKQTPAGHPYISGVGQYGRPIRVPSIAAPIELLLQARHTARLMQVAPKKLLPGR